MKAILNFLGLANRAGKVVSGEDLVLNKIQRKETTLVLIAGDASSQTQKMFLDKCKYYKVNAKIFSTKGELGDAIGKSPRSACAIVDKGFSVKLLSMIEQINGGDFHE